MPEFMKKYVSKEEDFLEEFYVAASAASALLGDDWHPNPSCNDSVRKNQEYFLGTGELRPLVFDGASVHHDDNGISSIQISLKSAYRNVTVLVRRVGSEMIAEKMIDRTNEQRT